MGGLRERERDVHERRFEIFEDAIEDGYRMLEAIEGGIVIDSRSNSGFNTRSALVPLLYFCSMALKLLVLVDRHERGDQSNIPGIRQ